MYYAMIFHPSEYNYTCVRALRRTPFKTIDAARNAIIKARKDGYVKQLNNPVPVWSNVV